MNVLTIKKNLFIYEITIYISKMGRPKRRDVGCQRPKRPNVPKRVAKFDCMHVPGRRQNDFLANVFGKTSR